MGGVERGTVRDMVEGGIWQEDTKIVGQYLVIRLIINKLHLL